jgi:hypothetical protein
MYCQIGYRTKGAEKQFLPLILIRVALVALYKCSKVSNSADRIARGQQPTTEAANVQPLKRGVFDSSVVKIESVYINVGLDCSAPQKARPPFGGLHPIAEAPGGIIFLLYLGAIRLSTLLIGWTAQDLTRRRSGISKALLRAPLRRFVFKRRTGWHPKLPFLQAFTPSPS